MDQLPVSIPGLNPSKSVPMVWGTGFDGYGYRWLKFYPRVTHVKHYVSPSLSNWMKYVLMLEHGIRGGILYHLIQFGTPCDAWRVWRSFGFGNLPNSPWHLEIFCSFAPQAAKNFYIWEPDHKMISAPYKNCRDQRDISAIWKAPWRVTAELN